MDALNYLVGLHVSLEVTKVKVNTRG